MGHWEQNKEDRLRAGIIPLWRRVVVEVMIGIASLVLWALLLSPVVKVVVWLGR